MVATTMKEKSRGNRRKAIHGFSLVDFILTVLAVMLITAGMFAMQRLLNHQAELNRLSQKEITGYSVLSEAAVAYVKQNNINSSTTITCNQLVPDYLPSSSDCQDAFGNTLSIYFNGNNAYYIYISQYSNSYQGWLDDYGFQNFPSLFNFYSSVLAVLSKMGQETDGAYDVLATNNSNMYDLAYGFKQVSNNVPVTVPIPSDSANQGYAFVVRYIQY